MKKFILSLLLLCTPILSQNIKVKLETVWEIGNEKEFRKEYFIKSPDCIVADKQGAIYVSENRGAEIRKFDKNGKYVKTIGRNGAGPGEFRHVEWMFLNSDNQIVVKDQMNGRYSYFSTDGKFLSMDLMTPTSRSIFKPEAFERGNVVGQLIVNGYKLMHGNKFGVYDNKLQNQLTSFGHSSIFWKYETVMDLHEDTRCTMPTAFFRGSKFITTKSFYDGRVFLFDKDKNWDIQILNGKNFNFPTYEIFEKDHSREEWDKHVGTPLGFGMEWQGKNRGFTVYCRVRSMGLFVYKDRYIVNFLSSYPSAKKVEHGVDLFTIEGKYLGYFKVDPEAREFWENVFCQDQEGNFFMKYYDGPALTIRKFRLIIE